MTGQSTAAAERSALHCEQPAQVTEALVEVSPGHWRFKTLVVAEAERDAARAEVDAVWSRLGYPAADRAVGRTLSDVLDEHEAELRAARADAAEQRRALDEAILHVAQRARDAGAWEGRAIALRDLLSEAAQQIEYLHDKFRETGSGNAVLARIAAALPLPDAGAALAEAERRGWGRARAEAARNGVDVGEWQP